MERKGQTTKTEMEHNQSVPSDKTSVEMRARGGRTLVEEVREGKRVVECERVLGGEREGGRDELGRKGRSVLAVVKDASIDSFTDDRLNIILAQLTEPFLSRRQRCDVCERFLPRP